MNQPQSPAVALISLIPLFSALVLVAIMIFFMAPRKGRSRAWALLGMIPLANILILIWMASLTDKAVLNALAELKRRNA
jgi:hypothetical protein